MAEREEELKSLLMRVKEESGKPGLNSIFKKKNHGTQSHHIITNRWGQNGNSDRFYFTADGAPKSLQMVIAATKLKDTCFLAEKL